MDTHQAFHPFVVHHPAQIVKLRGDPRRPIGATGVLVDVADLGDQEPFTNLADGDDPATVFLPVAIPRR